MATSCTSTPTLTSTSVSTSTSFSTTVSLSTSTSAGGITTSLLTTCVPVTVRNITTCTPETQTSTITLPDATATITVPVTVLIDVPITGLVTLFGSSCTTSPVTTPPVTTTPTTTPVSSPTDITSDTSTTSSSSLTTTSANSTTSVPSLTDSSTFTSTTSSSAAPLNTTLVSDTNQSGHKKSGNGAAIAGGVVGGIAALILLAFLTWRLIKKQPRFDDIFNSDKPTDGGPHYKKKVPEPKPYDYGMIGQQNANPIDMSPPGSPKPMQTTFGNQAAQAGQNGSSATGAQSMGQPGVGQSAAQANGMVQGIGNSSGAGQGVGAQSSAHAIGNASGQGLGPGQSAAPQPPAHLRTSSLTPLLAGVAAAAAAGGVNAAIAGSSRPSTSSSSLEPQVGFASPQNSGYPAQGASSPSMYPPALQNWAATQQQGQGYAAGVSNVQGYGSGPVMGQGAGPLSHNGSAGSYTSSAWGAPASSSGAQHVGIPPLVPVPVGGARRQSAQPVPPPPQQQQAYAQYEDPFARSGSPVSVQEQRILQVTNADPATPLYPPAGPSRQSYFGGQLHDAGSSSAGPSSANTAPAVDGKGRRLNLQGEKVPLVHLDGGLYQEPEPNAPAPAPPAYQI